MNRAEIEAILRRTEKRIEEYKKSTSTPHSQTELAAALRAALAEEDRLRGAVIEALSLFVHHDAPKRAKEALLQVMSVDELHQRMDALAQGGE